MEDDDVGDNMQQQLEENEEMIFSTNKKNQGCQRIFSHWRILLFGQIISFVLGLTSAAQATLSFQCSISAPSFTVGIIYIGLVLVFLIPVAVRQSHMVDASRSSNDITQQQQQQHRSFFFCNIPLHASPWFYAAAGIMDFYGNFFTNWAYKFTTITSAVLFDALAIPTTMILSRIFLQRQYLGLHILGVAICIAGVVMNVFTDYYQNDPSSSSEASSYASNRLLGDVLAIIGGILYGADDMICELSVRRLGGGLKEFLFMIGSFGSIIAFVQAFIMERDEMSWFFGLSSDVPNNTINGGNTCSRGVAWFLLLSFCIINVICYISIARFLQVSEAAFLNISLLTGDLWSVLFSVVAQKIIPAPLFFLALILVISGVLLYEMAPTPALEDRGCAAVDVLHQQQSRSSSTSEQEIVLQDGFEPKSQQECCPQISEHELT